MIRAMWKGVKTKKIRLEGVVTLGVHFKLSHTEATMDTSERQRC